MTEFKNEYEFLSNSYPSYVWFEEYEYPTVEHAFQAAKTLDRVKRLEICRMYQPGLAKRAGKKLELRPNWESIKDDIMFYLLLQKFSKPYLKGKLLRTGDEFLVEGNYWHDNYWGYCLCPKCDGLYIDTNHLGKLLIRIRRMYQ